MVTVNLKKTVLVLASLLSMKVAADTTDLQNQKSSEKIDFNHLIEEGNEKKQELTWKDASTTEETASAPQISASERKSVIDFIDVEVGVGKTPSVVGVDRRYNSVGEARRIPQSMGEAKVVDIDKLQVQLLKVKRKGT
jgi:hypothetical protein